MGKRRRANKKRENGLTAGGTMELRKEGDWGGVAARGEELELLGDRKLRGCERDLRGPD